MTDTKFKPGKSGNPAGRPQGAKNLENRDPLTIGLATKDRETVIELAFAAGAGIVVGIIHIGAWFARGLMVLYEFGITALETVWGDVDDAVKKADQIAGGALNDAKEAIGIDTETGIPKPPSEYLVALSNALQRLAALFRNLGRAQIKGIDTAGIQKQIDGVAKDLSNLGVDI